MTVLPFGVWVACSLLVQQDGEDEERARVPLDFRLTEVAAASGLDHVSMSGEPGKPRLPDQLGQGMAWFDYDGDGWLDLFVPNGSTLAHWRGEAENDVVDRLFRNRGDGTFEDVTEQAGLGSNRWGAGVAVGDIDRDGDPDLYVCNLGKNQMWRNDGDGTFTEIPAGAGAEFDALTPGAGLGDVDLDGDLDLYVAHYIYFDPQDPTPPFAKRVRDMMVAIGPKVLPPAPDRLFLNDGTGQFEDVTESSGLIKDKGRGFTVLILDFTLDDIPDIFVTCDESPNVFYRGLGDGKFREEGLYTGLAVGQDGKEDGCMGVGIGDMNNDMIPDLYVTNFYGELNALYISEGDRLWEHRTEKMERFHSSRPYVGWGVGYFDLDLDGDEDILAFNGHIHPQLDDEDPLFATYGEKPLLFRTERRLQFTEITDQVGGAFAELHSARGAAFADYDEDGDVDVAVTNVDGPIRLFRNDTETPYHFLKVQLEGTGNVNPDAYGARVTVEAGRSVQRRWVTGQGSYLCQNDARAHFGLGRRKEVDRVTVRWPGGEEEVVEGPIAGNQTIVIRRGSGLVTQVPRAQPMPGWRSRTASGDSAAETGAEGNADGAGSGR